jgi:hypothetical protein
VVIYIKYINIYYIYIYIYKNSTLVTRDIIGVSQGKGRIWTLRTLQPREEQEKEKKSYLLCGDCDDSYFDSNDVEISAWSAN